MALLPWLLVAAAAKYIRHLRLEIDDAKERYRMLEEHGGDTVFDQSTHIDNKVANQQMNIGQTGGEAKMEPSDTDS